MTNNNKKIRNLIEAISVGTKAISVGIKLAFSVIAGGFIGMSIGQIVYLLFGIQLLALFLMFGLFIGFIGGVYYIYKIFCAVK